MDELLLKERMARRLIRSKEARKQARLDRDARYANPERRRIHAVCDRLGISKKQFRKLPRSEQRSEVALESGN